MRNALIITAALALTGCAGKAPRAISHEGAPGIMESSIEKIDSIASDAIRRGAMPGCRIMAAKDGNVILDMCCGYLDYDSLQPVSASTIYDLASVTKIAASALAVMAMYDDGLIDLDSPICQYIDGLPGNGATLRDALAHQAGFKVGVPLASKLKDLHKAFPDPAARYDTAAARVKIAEMLASQDLAPKGKYLYSDYFFYFVPGIVEKLCGKGFDEFLAERFYRPMGIRPMFNPLRFQRPDSIAPTEIDTAWRRKTVRGTVHDEGAAMMGGVSGHAGLFASAGDVMAIMSLFLNGGEYGGRRYIRCSTVRLFTRQAFEGNRRGLVFDKPLLDTLANGTPSPKASRASFGHTGFTGPFAWADPENGLVFVFLCNRTYPSRGGLLSSLNVRTQIHDVFYCDSLLNAVAAR